MQKFLDKRIVSVARIQNRELNLTTAIIFNFEDNSAIKISAEFLEECYFCYLDIDEIKSGIPIVPEPEGKVTMYYAKGENSEKDSTT